MGLMVPSRVIKIDAGRAPTCGRHCSPSAARRSLSAQTRLGPAVVSTSLTSKSIQMSRPASRSLELAASAIFGVMMVALHRVRRPFPNGAWPGEFADLHEISLFALVTVVVGAALGAPRLGSRSSTITPP